MTTDGRRKVAAFDFDGTLSRRDTLVPFLSRVSGRVRFTQVCARLGLLGARRTLDVRDRDRVKERMIELLFAGRSEHELRWEGSLYARSLLSDALRPEMLARLRQHRELGHEVLFVSASLEFYLEPLAELLDLQGVIGVQLAADGDVLTGALARPNVRAAEKAVRLREWLGQPTAGPLEEVELWSYGNSSGDHALLELADHAFWLGRPSKVPAGSRKFVPGSVAA